MPSMTYVARGVWSASADAATSDGLGLGAISAHNSLVSVIGADRPGLERPSYLLRFANGTRKSLRTDQRVGAPPARVTAAIEISLFYGNQRRSRDLWNSHEI